MFVIQSNNAYIKENKKGGISEVNDINDASHYLLEKSAKMVKWGLIENNRTYRRLNCLSVIDRFKDD